MLLTDKSCNGCVMGSVTVLESLQALLSLIVSGVMGVMGTFETQRAIFRKTKNFPKNSGVLPITPITCLCQYQIYPLHLPITYPLQGLTKSAGLPEIMGKCQFFRTLEL
jgi:hypothetical protein